MWDTKCAFVRYLNIILLLLKSCQTQQQQLNFRSKIRCTVCRCKKTTTATKIQTESSNLDIHNEIFSTSANRSRAKAVTALPPPHTSPGLTEQWKAWNSRTTDYHTAPSLASCCWLMGSWKVEMKKAILPPCLPVSDFLPPSLCCQWQMSQFLSVWLSPSLPLHKWDCTERRERKSRGEIQRRYRSHENNKKGQVISVKLLWLNPVFWKREKHLLCSLNQR